MDNEDGSISSRIDKSRFNLPELNTRWILVWFVAFAIMILIAFLIPIPLLSNFAEHLPISYGALLIIVPLIAYLT
ncbi:MAG: hypothetical protein ACFFF4_15745, partial [Candidatus Thorarchaeota archaeon]